MQSQKNSAQSLDLATLDDITPTQAKALLIELDRVRNKKHAEKSLAEFVKQAWHEVEPGRPLIWNWHLDTLCGYLEAVFRGDIRRLIINIPPGTMKSLIVSVFYPAWVWIHHPSHRFLCGSNEGTLATRDSLRMRTLIQSVWYKENWGEKIKISPDQREKTLFKNTAEGHRESQGVLGKITGKRGDTLMWDDPHDAKQTESETIRSSVLESWDSAWSSRMNDPDSSAVIIIMQRVHQEDITGHLLKKTAQDWVHLAIPMKYDSEVTFDAGLDIGRPDLNDPRTEEGELLFPQRFSAKAVSDLETDLGPYGSAGQLQQRPSPKGGGEFKSEWLKFYIKKPHTGNRIILVDPAGERKPGVNGKRDNSAMGVFELGSDKNYYLIDGYRDRLSLHERAKILFKWHREHQPIAVGYEKYSMQSDLVYIESEMERLDYRFDIVELGGSLRKEDRIRRLIPIFAAKRMWLPETLYRTSLVTKEPVDIIDRFKEEEYLRFPVAPFDDFFDMMSRLLDEDFEPHLFWPEKSENLNPNRISSNWRVR